MSGLAALATPLLAVLLTLAGLPWVRRLPGTWAERLVCATLAGSLTLHLVLTTLDLVGVSWSPAALVLPLLGAAMVTRAIPGRPAAAGSPPGWGDQAAMLAVVTFAALACTLWITFPDFIYHWGLKGHRYYLARGIDYEYLAHPWSWPIHPDYPHLLPELFAATALLAGRWAERGLLLWSPVHLALLLLAAREALALGGVRRPQRQAVVAILGCSLAAFGIGHLMAGAADWLVALALTAAVPALLRPPDRPGDLQLGLCAAFAAAAKMEGLPLAAALVGVQLARHLRVSWKSALLALPALGAALALVTVPWAVQVVRHSLFQPANTGAVELGRALAAAPALLQAAATPAWAGLPAALLLLPWLLARRRVRPIAAVATLQLLFYGWQYLAAPLDTPFLVLSTFARFALHLLPTVLTAAAIAWLGEPDARESRGTAGAA